MSGERMRANRLLIVLLVIVVIGLASPTRVSQTIVGYLKERLVGQSQSSSNEVVVWHPWGGTNKEALEAICREFEKAHPGIKVRLLFTPYSSSGNQKFFTAVACGRPPDVIFVAGASGIAEFAWQGAVQPLDDRIERAGLKPDDFFEFCWRQSIYDNHIWALQYCGDPCFAFAWNKDVFRKAGLDPERPPRTIAELDEMADKLTSRNKSGELESMGILPWALCGNPNAMLTWGFIFGGEFYDEKSQKITANHPKNVEALKWMCSYARKYDITKINSLGQGFGAMDKQPFYIGQLGMTGFHIAQVEDAKKYAPHLDYGLTYMPYPPGGEPRSSWVGGWCMALPRGSRNPDLGWKLIKWLCADPHGTELVGRLQGMTPGYRKSLYFDQIKDDPKYGQFLRMHLVSKHQWPVTPATSYYAGALDRAVEAALYGLKSPKQALDDATVETQRELDFRLTGKSSK